MGVWGNSRVFLAKISFKSSNMDSNYRRELKKHLKKSFQTNKLERSQQSPATDFVQTLLPSSSNIQASTSRTIDALLDISLSSCSDEGMFEAHEFPNYTNPGPSSSIAIDDSKSRDGGVDTKEKSLRPTISSQTFGSNANTMFSKNSNFKRRTSRDLRHMVKSQCKVVESLNIVSSNTNVTHTLPPSMLLWKSKRMFSSSVDLRSDILKRSEESSSNSMTRKKYADPTQEMLSATFKGLTDINAEKIVRDQITGPLIREVERAYVQSITTTADLLKKLECMPGDINRVLTRKRK